MGLIPVSFLTYSFIPCISFEGLLCARRQITKNRNRSKAWPLKSLSFQRERTVQSNSNGSRSCGESSRAGRWVWWGDRDPAHSSPLPSIPRGTTVAGGLGTTCLDSYTHFPIGLKCAISLPSCPFEASSQIDLPKPHSSYLLKSLSYSHG